MKSRQQGPVKRRSYAGLVAIVKARKGWLGDSQRQLGPGGVAVAVDQFEMKVGVFLSK